MKLSFWLSSREPSGGAKVLAEHAKRLAARGHEVLTAFGERAPRLEPGFTLVVTRYRDVLPALERTERVLHLVQGLDVAEGGRLARWRKGRRVARAFAAPVARLAVSQHLAARFAGALLAPTGVDLAVFEPGERARRRVLLSGLGPTKRIEAAFSALEGVRGIEVIHLVPNARLSESEAAALIRSSSVYLSAVAPEEGFDLVALEAMASGVACVLSGGGAHRELAPGLVAGFEPEALRAALAGTLDDPTEDSRRVALGLDAARQRSWDLVIASVEEAYREAAR